VWNSNKTKSILLLNFYGVLFANTNKAINNIIIVINEFIWMVYQKKKTKRDNSIIILYSYKK